MRKFQSGQHFKIKGAPELAIQKGKKSASDLVIMWKYDGRWSAVPYSILAILVEFFYENEGILYPPSAGFQGGERIMDFLYQAVDDGHEAAIRELQRDKDRLAARTPVV